GCDGSSAVHEGEAASNRAPPLAAGAPRGRLGMSILVTGPPPSAEVSTKPLPLTATVATGAGGAAAAARVGGGGGGWPNVVVRPPRALKARRAVHVAPKSADSRTPSSVRA